MTLVLGVDGLPETLEELAEWIRGRQQTVEEHGAVMIYAAWEAGAMLRKAKGILPHGGWLPWLADNFPFSQQTASLYMRIADNYGTPRTLPTSIEQARRELAGRSRADLTQRAIISHVLAVDGEDAARDRAAEMGVVYPDVVAHELAAEALRTLEGDAERRGDDEPIEGEEAIDLSASLRERERQIANAHVRRATQSIVSNCRVIAMAADNDFRTVAPQQLAKVLGPEDMGSLIEQVRSGRKALELYEKKLAAAANEAAVARRRIASRRAGR